MKSGLQLTVYWLARGMWDCFVSFILVDVLRNLSDQLFLEAPSLSHLTEIVLQYVEDIFHKDIID